MVFSSEINGFGRRSFWYALPSQLTPATLSVPSPTTAPFQARSLLLSTVARRKSGAKGDGLRRSIDDFLSQVLLLTI